MKKLANLTLEFPYQGCVEVQVASPTQLPGTGVRFPNLYPFGRLPPLSLAVGWHQRRHRLRLFPACASCRKKSRRACQGGAG